MRGNEITKLDFSVMTGRIRKISKEQRLHNTNRTIVKLNDEENNHSLVNQEIDTTGI